MSGGYLESHHNSLCYILFDDLYLMRYGEHVKASRDARKHNPLDDKIISELVYDVLCLLHSFDYYRCADISEEKYQMDVAAFKHKWLRSYSKQEMKSVIDDEIDAVKNELYRTYGIAEK